MAVALRGPDAESWLTDVQMIDSASVRVHPKRRQLLSRRRLACGGLTLFLGFGTAPVRRANPSRPHNRAQANVWSICFRYPLGRQFKKLKGDLAIRPIFHQLEARIEAHIFIAFLAYCLHVTLARRLHALARRG
jgi:hypothetical protein